MHFQPIIIALWIAWAAFWTMSATGNKPAVRRAKFAWKYSGFLVVAVLVVVFAMVPGHFHARIIPSTFPILASGTALTALGLAFSVWARIILGRNWSATPTIKAGHELIVAGPYRLVRHPIYTGLLLAIFGTCLAHGRVSDLSVFLALTAVIIAKLRAEEALMLQQFPAAYPEYRRRTKVLIPFIV